MKPMRTAALAALTLILLAPLPASALSNLWYSDDWSSLWVQLESFLTNDTPMAEKGRGYIDPDGAPADATPTAAPGSHCIDPDGQPALCVASGDG